MENPTMALLSSSSSPKPAFSQCFSTNPFRPSRLSSSLLLLFAPPSPRTSKRVSFSVRALKGDVGAGVFASLSSGKGQQTTSTVGSPNLAVPPPPSSSSVGSPLFWIGVGVGVGVGFSAIFSFVAARSKALKGNQNGAAFKEVEVDSQAGQPTGKAKSLLNSGSYREYDGRSSDTEDGLSRFASRDEESSFLQTDAPKSSNPQANRRHSISLELHLKNTSTRLWPVLISPWHSRTQNFKQPL